jgi:hypothetical protein
MEKNNSTISINIDDLSSSSNDLTCPVCLTNVVNSYSECCHGYCSDCLQKLKLCALCRTPICSENENNINKPPKIIRTSSVRIIQGVDINGNLIHYEPE